MMTRKLPLFALFLCGLAACGDDTTTTTGSSGSGGGSGSGGEAGQGGGASTTTGGPGSGGGVTSTGVATGSASSSSSTGTGGGSSCRALGAADRDRYVVVGLPYGENDYVTDYGVLRLTTAGELQVLPDHFYMGSAEIGTIAFTPDGEIGVAVQRDGSLGIFRVASDGSVTVIDPAFQPGDFYATSVVMDPSGEFVLVANVNWPESGGGLYRVDLDCVTGAPTLVGRQIETKNAWALLSLGGGRWAVAGRGAGSVEDATDVFDIRAGDPWTRAGGTNAFDYEDSIPGGFAAAKDRSFLLVGDISEFSGQPTNVRFVAADDAGFTAAGAPLVFEDPYALAIAPEGDVALIASGYGDALFIVDIDPASGTPLSVRGELAYATQSPQLPGPMVTVDRGTLAGTVLNIDIEGLRKVRFIGNGQLVDDGLTSVGVSNAGLINAVGVQP